MQAFIALLSLVAEATTASHRQKTLFILFVASSVLAVVFDLINEKEKIQHTTALGDALLSSLLSRFVDLLEQMEIDLSELDINFQVNKTFYHLYKDSLFLFSPFLGWNV